MSLIHPHPSFIPHPAIPFLTQNQKLITSCTNRLLQLQHQLQSKTLKQQLVSSLTMKDFSLRKLIEQQNLLIVYLKDELKELEARRAHGIQMEQAIIEMEEKYLALGELKGMDETEGERYLVKLKAEYNQLHDVLNQMAKESSTLYELKIKLSNRNTFTGGLLAERAVQYGTVKQEHERQFTINEKLRTDCKILSDQNQKDNSLNSEFSQQLRSKKTQLQDNKLKLSNLQKQVQKYQQESGRLKGIKKAAQKDNNLLKQTLKDKVETMKQKQQWLKGLKNRKQLLQKQKSQENENLTKIVEQKEELKQKQSNEQSNGQALEQRYQLVTREKFTAQTQLQTLSEQIHYIKNLKHSTITSCLQRQQTVQKNIYFIDQYMLINSELLAQIQILLSEEINESTLSSIHFKNYYQVNRSNQIFELRQFLSRIMQQMNNTQTNLDLIVTGFNNYKLC